MKYRYTFWNDSEFLGELFVENDQAAKEIAQRIGANGYRNTHTKTNYKKCSNCGAWESPQDLIKGLCSYCHYVTNIKNWLAFYDEELALHFENEVDNYGEEFKITFKGKELTLTFGPDEDEFFINGIRNLLEYAQEELEQYKENNK